MKDSLDFNRFNSSTCVNVLTLCFLTELGSKEELLNSILFS